MSINWAERLAAIGLSAEEATRKAAVMRHTNADAAWWVPGRIEFLGKHTDYAGGRSLLCATERGFCIAGSPRSDGVVAIRDAGSGTTVNNRYTDAVQARLTRNFGALAGADISFHSDLPVAAGLSSSSALVVALSVILIELNRLDERPEWLESIPDADTLAEYLSCVENGFSFGKLEGDRGVGTLSGSEDHTAITRSEKGRLIRYSFKPVCASGSVPLPEGHIFVIASSGVQAEKGGASQAKYNKLATVANDVLYAWNVTTAREDVSLGAAFDDEPDALQNMRAILDEEELARVEHFHTESKILIPAAVLALQRNDLATLGHVVDRSQDAAERLLGNQIPETSWLAGSARERGAVAASAFGAGWGGSVWALVPASGAVTFMEDWARAYREKFPERDGTFFITRAASAARRLI
jgi:galactokinase